MIRSGKSQAQSEIERSSDNEDSRGACKDMFFRLAQVLSTLKREVLVLHPEA